MKPTVVALVAALVSGSAMYTVGARGSNHDALHAAPAVLETPSPAAAVPARFVSADLGRAPESRRVTPVAASAPRTVVVQESKPRRSWKTSALIIGGSAASGAGVGGAIAGKKGAMTGAAIGGGAASIYEAIRRQ